MNELNFTFDTTQTDDEIDNKHAPLAAKMRPTSLDEYVGQKHLLGEGKLLRRAIESDRINALLLWGPPGVGKTSLAEVIARQTACEFVRMSGVFSTVSDMRRVIAEAESRRYASKRGTLVFIDEIHRWNKAQQDVLLPYVERGVVRLIGATTENPHFYVVGPLLSRSLTFALQPLTEADLRLLMERAAEKMGELIGSKVTVLDDAKDFIAKCANGDARKAIGAIEMGALSTPVRQGAVEIDVETAESSMQQKQLQYGDDGHYDTISAFIKSMRGSDVDATLYYLAKMLHVGEDLQFIARRMVIFASEDVGNADPRALQMALSAQQALAVIGMPESRIILSQVVSYLATAPKSNAAYLAIDLAMNDVRTETVDEVPKHLRDAHYKGAKSLGHGDGYLYPHDFEGHYVPQDYMISEKRYYLPGQIGYERTIAERMDYWRKVKQTAKKGIKNDKN